jgi:hypothetical protein
MDLSLEIEPGGRLVARVRDGAQDALVTAAGAQPAAAALADALEPASPDGDGECFRPEPTGQRIDDERRKTDLRS